jgi:uncharacterized membrane protein (DUF373 family)
LARYQRVVRKVEFAVVTALEVFIMLMVTIATVVLFVLFTSGLRTQLQQMESSTHLQSVLQAGFGGVLTVLLGLELLETLRTYFNEHHIRIEVVLVVAMISIGRHIIQFDFEHSPAVQVFGLGALMLSFALGYFLVKKAHANLPPGSSDSFTDS